MRMRLRSVLAAWAAAVHSAVAGEPIVVQAEDFTCDGTSWIVREQVGPYAPDSGLKHLWGARGGQGTAWRDVQVPKAGRYSVWVRHTVMKGGEAGAGRGPFQVRLEHNRTALTTGVFDEAPPSTPPRRIHRYDFSQFAADLPAGQVRVQITKLPPVTCSGWTRQLDCLVFSDDPDYVPKATDFQPKTWLRVTLGPTQTTPVYIHCFCDHFRAPWYKHFSLSRDGYEERVAPRRGKAAFLSAGDSTPWCDITPAIHEDTGARMELRVAAKYSYTEWMPACDALFEFATAPDDASVVKRFRREGPGAGLAIITPGVLSPETVDRLKCDNDYYREARALADTLPDVSFGKRPERFPFFLSVQLRRHLFSPDIREGEFRIGARMGFNGAHGPLEPALRKMGYRHTRTGTGSWYMDNRCYLQPQTERIAAKIADVAEEWRESPPRLVMFMDEPTARSLSHAPSCEHCRTAFAAWLRNEIGVPPAELGVGSWHDVRPVTAEARDSEPALYYYSQRFRCKALGDFLRLQTAQITRRFGSSQWATVNFSDGAVYGANMLLQGVDYFHLFRRNALTMAWSEDWSNIASTYQCCGYNVDLLRAASRAHGQPIGMYLITSHGRTPLDVKLKAYSSLGRGARVLESYTYGPTYGNHSRGWYMHENMYGAMAELCHEIGAAEDLLLEARRTRSDVAFLYSVTSDVWTVGETNLYGHERMHSYLALLHAQVPVDFLSEDDVVEGRLEPYKVLYAFGPNLLDAAVEPIARWVRAGGTLFLAAGAATADEYNRAGRRLDDRLDLERGDVETLEASTGPGRYLRTLKTHGQVAFGTRNADLLGVLQLVGGGAQAVAEALATSPDGRTVAVRVGCGKGTVFAVGFMPGLSYIRKALIERDKEGTPAPDPDDELDFALRGSFSNLRPSELSYNPCDYPEAERDFLLEPVRHAGVVTPVALSHPLVETFYLEAPRGAVVTLANYGIRPLERLTVTVRPRRGVRRIESVRRGPLAFEAAEGAVTLSLPLADTDMVKLYW